ncbi:hypothetical protein FB45DRAFT_1009113 [Roridomyces roridus]|uniref:Uncharacterized protein n=1 Tax=Roridomyces roridus TaxID=1738132 RepID=A0AAD7FB04_9AGAR|nr:hypothetical protein FB45DRAFT_1009113 [Roridomyces roridus]
MADCADCECLLMFCDPTCCLWTSCPRSCCERDYDDNREAESRAGRSFWNCWCPWWSTTPDSCCGRSSDADEYDERRVIFEPERVQMIPPPLHLASIDSQPERVEMRDSGIIATVTGMD